MSRRQTSDVRAAAIVRSATPDPKEVFVRWLSFPLVLIGMYVLLVALAWVFQRRLLYLPLGGYVPAAAAVLPGSQEVTLDTADGLRLGAWYVPPSAGAPRATVIVCNGNAGNRADRAALAGALSSQGLAVLLFDYRGYGGNPGTPSETGLIADLAAARRYADATLGVPLRRQVLFGESLGAAVALAGAVAEPPAGLVLRSPFTSLAAVGRLHYPFLPVALLLQDRFPNLERIRGLACPLLVLAGGLDRIVPVEQSRELHAAAPGADTLFVYYPEADHNSRRFLDDPQMIREVAVFAGRVAATR